MVLERFGRWIYPVNAWLNCPKSNSIFSKENQSIGEELVSDTWPSAAVVLLASAGVPGQSKPCSWGAVTTCDGCNLRYWKCFVACRGLAAVSITHRATCQRLFPGTSQCSNLKSMIQTHCELFGVPFFPPCSPPICEHLQAVFWPWVHRPVPLELCSAVESQGSECASPFRADLQPLSCSLHDGRTSVKDVRGLSILKPASVFNWRSEASMTRSGTSS